MAPKRRLNLALIGAGEWAVDYHLPTIYSDDLKNKLNLCGIWNRTRSKAERAARKWGIPQIYTSLNELMQDSNIDAVSVVVNRQAVGRILRMISERNLPLLCEKPPGKNYQEARKLSAMVNPRSAVAFNRRYSPLNQKFKSLVDKLESIQFVECHFLRRHRDDQKFVSETGVHGINFLEYLLGPIRTVDAERWFSKEKNNYNWLARITFASGLRGLIKFFPSAGISLETLEVHGDDVSLYLDSDQHFTDTTEGSITIYKNTQQNKIAKRNVFVNREGGRLKRGGFVGEYLDFIAAVQKRRSPLSNFGNSWTSMQAAEIIERGKSGSIKCS
jgi:predicted dehydrogenase